MRKTVCICFVLIVLGCSHGSVPKGILEPHNMEKVVYDLLRVDEYLNSFAQKDTITSIKMKRRIFYDQVFKLHGTDRKQFYTSFKYYQQHPDIQKTLFDSVLAMAGRGSAVMPPRIVPIKSAKEK